jgi:hypothetical protein
LTKYFYFDIVINKEFLGGLIKNVLGIGHCIKGCPENTLMLELNLGT